MRARTHIRMCDGNVRVDNDYISTINSGEVFACILIIIAMHAFALLYVAIVRSFHMHPVRAG